MWVARPTLWSPSYLDDLFIYLTYFCSQTFHIYILYMSFVIKYYFNYHLLFPKTQNTQLSIYIFKCTANVCQMKIRLSVYTCLMNKHRNCFFARLFITLNYRIFKAFWKQTSILNCSNAHVVNIQRSPSIPPEFDILPEVEGCLPARIPPGLRTKTWCVSPIGKLAYTASCHPQCQVKLKRFEKFLSMPENFIVKGLKCCIGSPVFESRRNKWCFGLGS